MEVNLILDLAKAGLGISTQVRDAYLTAIIEGVLSELESIYGIELDKESPAHLMFVVDYVRWQYRNTYTDTGNVAVRPPPMPRHLQFRLHNLLLSTKGGE